MANGGRVLDNKLEAPISIKVFRYATKMFVYKITHFDTFKSKLFTLCVILH